MSFLVYDLILLGIFAILLGIFLFRKRKELKREGLVLLHKTKWGINLIRRVGERHEKGLKVLGYISVTLGYLLMAGMIYLVGRIVWIYVLNPEVVRAIKVPPITPLIPYLPQIFKLNFLPPFYFTYWIIIIAIIAITHEFAHGIFAARSNVKIKSTGFGFFPFFLPVFLAAFVELDDKKMAKKKISDQLAILSAGTFANVLTALVFSLIMLLFLSLAFAPSGVAFDSYPYNSVALSSIVMVNGIALNSPTYSELLGSLNETGLNEIQTYDGDYVATKEIVKQQNSEEAVTVYYDAPAIRASLESVILSINGEYIGSVEELADELERYAPGTLVTLEIIGQDNEPYNVDVVLGANPGDETKSWLGIRFDNKESGGILTQLYSKLFSLNRDHIHYASKIGDIGLFIYHLLWWLIIISISVALVNMLPMGIFDGGKFFYLTILGITRSENAAKRAYKIATYFFLAVLFLVMFFWAKAFF